MTSDDLWLWYVTFDLINKWRNPYCIFDPSLVVIGLKLFKGDPNKENLTKLEHTHVHTHYIHTYRWIRYRKIPHCFQARGIKIRVGILHIKLSVFYLCRKIVTLPYFFPSYMLLTFTFYSSTDFKLNNFFNMILWKTDMNQKYMTQFDLTLLQMYKTSTKTDHWDIQIITNTESILLHFKSKTSLHFLCLHSTVTQTRNFWSAFSFLVSIHMYALYKQAVVQPRGGQREQKCA